MTNRDRQIIDKLGAAGVRYTTGRRVVVSALASAGGPRSAAELHAEITPSVPLSSLYRSLSVLEGAGILEPHHGARDIVRYELAEWLTGHHHHLICVQCGAVEDVALPVRLEDELESVVARVTGTASFQAEGHSLEVEGRCRRCA